MKFPPTSDGAKRRFYDMAGISDEEIIVVHFWRHTNIYRRGNQYSLPYRKVM